MKNLTIEVTDVSMKLTNNKGMRAICNIVINGMISINDVRVIQGTGEKLFVAMPSKKMPDDRFKDMANPINAKARKIIEEAVIGKYEEMSRLDESFLELISC